MDYQLDLSSYRCPLPLLMTKKALQKLSQWQSLRIQINHQSVYSDFVALCEDLGFYIEKVAEEEGRLTLKISKLDQAAKIAHIL